MEERTEVVHGPGLEVHPSLPPVIHDHPAMWLHPAGRKLENRAQLCAPEWVNMHSEPEFKCPTCPHDLCGSTQVASLG